MKNYTKTTGNIVRDPEIKVTPNGKAVADFTVAVNSRVKGEDGKYVNKEGAEAEFYRVTAWEGLAEKVGNELKKGDLVKIEGELTAKPYMSKSGEAKVDQRITLRKFELKYSKDKEAVKEPAAPQMDKPQQAPPAPAR
jgi:single-strand DNA-binding protein